uniref:Uncharacterized AAA domain-containing protein ycf46 n=1 Tax=Gastroclonium compressum TaxID=1852973 RepID=A0A173FZU4_GASCM|nr:AAA domain-containing protein Ycf46 [Coeloseira compressa]ANH09551.1 AAA domain-containing protein Ycf46 [Coeloseira compressa]
MNFFNKIFGLLVSQYSIIYIVTEEENRLVSTINELIEKKYHNCLMYSWNFIDGYNNNPNYIGEAAKNPLEALEIIQKTDSRTSKIFILKDFHVFVNDISISRKLKNISGQLKSLNCSIVIVASELSIPTTLKSIVMVTEFPLPTLIEIQLELERLSFVMSYDVKKIQYLKSLAKNYQGFTIDQIRRSVARFILSKKSLEQMAYYILEEKKELIKQTDILEFYPSNQTLEDIGGLTNLKHWLIKRSMAFSDQAYNYGLPKPKGLLLVGVQGTGKSLSAKVISQQWNLPLLKLDIGKIFAGLVGESEKRIREVIQISEKLAPCILWIDEIDKAFFNSSRNIDSGTTNRVFSSFLSWLSEKETSVFVVATANNIDLLPSELVRKGRFDEIFFLDLPNMEERRHIFKIHLLQFRPLSIHKFHCNELADLTDGFSGAEIKQSIVEAMHNAFYEKREFEMNDIKQAIDNSIPLSITNKSSISLLQEWSRLGKIRLASEQNSKS